MKRYLGLDSETGGIGLDKSLLTAYFAVYDEGFNILDDLYLNCKPKDGIYLVTGEAMKINGIDLSSHDQIAEDYAACGTKLYQFLDRNSNNGSFKLDPLGQNVKTDINQVCDKLVSPGSWLKFCSYRVLDTATISKFLIDCGILPDTITGSLQSLVEFFKIGTQGEVHNAKTDVLLTVETYKRLKEKTLTYYK